MEPLKPKLLILSLGNGVSRLKAKDLSKLWVKPFEQIPDAFGEYGYGEAAIGGEKSRLYAS